MSALSADQLKQILAETLSPHTESRRAGMFHRQSSREMTPPCTQLLYSTVSLSQMYLHHSRRTFT
jgi:hypothetical protein